MDIETKILKRLVGKESKPKLLIVGSARHGKNTFAEILNEEFGFKINGDIKHTERFIYVTAIKM